MMQLHLAMWVSFILQKKPKFSGKVIKTFVIGDEKISDAKVYLQKAIENYMRTLSTFHAGVSIKVLEVLKGMTLFFSAKLHSRSGCNNEISKSI